MSFLVSLHARRGCSGSLRAAVIGTLEAPDYGLFVSHNNPDGQVKLLP